MGSLGRMAVVVTGGALLAGAGCAREEGYFKVGAEPEGVELTELQLSTCLPGDVSEGRPQPSASMGACLSDETGVEMDCSVGRTWRYEHWLSVNLPEYRVRCKSKKD